MHDEIKKFTMDGIVADEADIVVNKETVVYWLECEMRDSGFAPVLDIEPQYTQDYNMQQNLFEFRATRYGVYVGEDKSWQVSGVMDGKKIMKSIPRPKLKES